MPIKKPVCKRWWWGELKWKFLKGSKGRNFTWNLNDLSIINELVDCSNEQVKFLQISSDNVVLSSVIEKAWCRSNFLWSLLGSKWAITMCLVSTESAMLFLFL